MLGESSQPDCAWMCPPQENRLFAFDGRLLHGVVPYLSSLKPDEDLTRPRITLMMGWWPAGVIKSPVSRKGVLAPNMTLPKSAFRHSRSSAAHPRWLDALAGDGREYSHQPDLSSGIIEIRSPIWEVLSRNNEDSRWSSFANRARVKVENSVKERRRFERIRQLASEQSVSFVGNWFLKSLDDIGSEITNLSSVSLPSSTKKRKKSCQSNSDEKDSNIGGESCPIEWISVEELNKLRKK